MRNEFTGKILVPALIMLFVLANASAGSNQNAKRFNATTDAEFLEEEGLGDISNLQGSKREEVNNGKKKPDSSRPKTEVLLIPNSEDDNVGMYDPYDGTYLGLFISGYDGFTTPVNAVTGPDGNVYVSDQVSDAVFVFSGSGNYLSTYADASDGLNNIRGIDFRGDTLFVTSGDDYVAMFDGPHSRLADFINDGSEPFDILFLDDGRSLLSDIQGSTDNVRLYNADGSFSGQLFSISFPEQIQVDAQLPGEYLNTSFSADRITDFDLDGTIQDTTIWDSGRGVYRLGNGNLLATSGSGVFEIDPATGNIIEQEAEGSGRFIELSTYEEQIPTLSEWGLIILALLLLAAGTIGVILKRKGVTVY